MTGMENAIEKAARAIYGSVHRDTDPYSVPLERAAEKAARALADAGLLAVAPLTVMYAEGIKHPDFGWLAAWDKVFTNPNTVRERLGGDRGTIIRRHVTAWEPHETVEPAEGDRRAEQ